jgi:hypothetical protein
MPQFKDRWQKKQIAGGDFSVLRLDGSLIPWDQIPLRDLEANPGDFDDLIKKLKEVKLTVTVGLRERFVLVSLAEDTALLESLGKGQTLADRPEMQRLAKFADRKLTGVVYASKAWQDRQSMRPQDMEEWVKTGLGKLKQLGLTPEQEAKIRKDLQKLTKDLKSFLPEPGAHAAISFLTDRGQEVYAFDWAKNLRVDGSKPLSILGHGGESPLIFTASRRKYDPQHYANLVKWIKTGNQYLEEIILPKFNVEAFYQLVIKQLQPALERIDKATGEMLLPALADGQWAFVLDAKLAGKQWHQAMPQADKDLPLPEFALVFGVKDAALLRKAFDEYRQAINTLLATASNFVPGAPELKISPPESKQVKGATLYYYPLPAELGLDSRIVPTAGLSERFAVLTLSREHASRLLKPAPLKSTTPVLADHKRALVSATHVDGAGLVHLVSPWVDYILVQVGVEDNIRGQVMAAIEVLTVFRGYSSISYFEDGVLVTHSETMIRDLGK